MEMEICCEGINRIFFIYLFFFSFAKSGRICVLILLMEDAKTDGGKEEDCQRTLASLPPHSAILQKGIEIKPKEKNK